MTVSYHVLSGAPQIFGTKRLLGGFCSRQIFRHWSQQPEALPALSDLHELALSGCSACESLSALRYLPIKAKKKMIHRSEKPKKLRSLWCLFALHPPPGEEKPLYAAAFCQIHSWGTSHFESFCMLFFLVTFVSSFFSRSDV